MAPPTSSWRIEWVRDWSHVWHPEFVARWNAMRAACPEATAYHEPSLVRAWAETCGAAAEIEPMIGVASDSDGHALLLPWAVVPSRGRVLMRRTIEGAGGELFGYHDPIVTGGAADVDWDACWRACRHATGGAAHQVLLRSVRASVAGRAFAAEAAEPAPILRLDAASLDDMLARCSANHRGDVHRRMRRVREAGETRLWIAGGGEQYPEAFQDLCAAYDARQQVRPDYPALTRPGLREFWRRVATDGVREGWGHLSALFVGDRPVAWHLGLFHRGDLYWWLPAHAPDWETYSPGKVMIAVLIEHGIAAGWRAVHMLTGGQPYKRAWRPEFPERRVLRWHADTLAGTLLSHYDRRPVASA